MLLTFFIGIMGGLFGIGLFFMFDGPKYLEKWSVRGLKIKKIEKLWDDDIRTNYTKDLKEFKDQARQGMRDFIQKYLTVSCFKCKTFDERLGGKYYFCANLPCPGVSLRKTTKQMILQSVQDREFVGLQIVEINCLPFGKMIIKNKDEKVCMGRED